MFVLALVFVGLAFFGDNFMVAAPGSGQTIIQTKNGTYGYKEFSVQGSAPIQLLSNARTTDAVQPVANFIDFLWGRDYSGLQFFANRIILQEEAKRLGLVPSSQQVEAKIMSFPAFLKEDNTFDREAFGKFEKLLGRYGLTTKDYYELVRDSLSFDRLTTLLTEGLELDSSYLTREFNSIAATQKLKTATLTLDQFNQEDQIPDGDLKTYWEPHKTRYMSDETRSAKVYVFSPVEKPVVAATKDDEAEKDNEHHVPASTLKVAESVENIWEEVVNKKQGHGLDSVIAEKSADNAKLYTVSSEILENFSLNNPPELLKKELNPAGGQQEASLIEAAFKISPGGTASDNISNTLVLSDGNVVIFQLIKITESIPLEFEKAKESALTDYRAEQAEKRLDEAAEELRQSLVTGLAEHKNFDDIASKSNARTDILDKNNSGWETIMMSSNNPALLFHYLNRMNPVYYSARLINAGEVSPVISNDKQSRVVMQVADKYIEDSTTVTSTRQLYKVQFGHITKMNILGDWFHAEHKKRDLKFTQAAHELRNNR